MFSKILLVLLWAGCTRSSTIESRVNNGTIAKEGDVPYHVALYKNGDLHCSGSLISTEWVITAGHCCQHSTYFVAKFGLLKTSGATPLLELTIPSQNFIIHPNMSRATGKGDVCLLHLPSPVKYTKKISRVELTNGTYVSYAGLLTQISGYATNNVLSYIKLHGILSFVCEQVYGPKRYHHTNNICIGTRYGKSACFHDSGGPLYNEEYGLIGVVSYSAEYSCGKNYPNVFSRLSYYYNWIVSKTGPLK